MRCAKVTTPISFRLHRIGAVTPIDANLSYERGMKRHSLLCMIYDLLCMNIEKRDLTRDTIPHVQQVVCRANNDREACVECATGERFQRIEIFSEMAVRVALIRRWHRSAIVGVAHLTLLPAHC
jgi:hypothetical protein